MRVMNLLGMRRNLIIATIILLSMLAILLLYQSHKDDDIADRFAIFPSLQTQYGQLSDNINNATSDTLLRVDSDSPLQLSRDRYRGCIRGGFTKTYGTDRSYQDVLTDYEKIPLGPEWTMSTEGNYSGYNTKTGAISLHIIDPSSSSYPQGGKSYQTIYQVTLLYADPEIERCYG